jgi:hypothetical protein
MYGWVFGMGMAAMALAWMACTGLAGLAWWCGNRRQRQEWMIRSCVVSFGFVAYQILLELFNLLDLGTTVEQLAAASWACWSLPLLAGECALQTRKIVSGRARTRPVAAIVKLPSNIKSGAA